MGALIETYLRDLPGVGDAAVTRVADRGGNRVVAYVVPDAGSAGGTGVPVRSGHEEARIAEWQIVYDDLYRRSSVQDPTFNLAGWVSQYTDQALSAAEMDAWVDDAVRRILSLRPRRVLEIGCGTGLLLWRVAPRCESYVATDLSERAVSLIEREVAAGADRWPHVRARCRAADDFTGFEPGEFDTVILNSVVQYFPSSDYLARVLAGSVELLHRGGRLFIGDVRDFRLLRALHTSLAVARADDAMPMSELRRRIQDSLDNEEELVIDPAFFRRLPAVLPRVAGLCLHVKRGGVANELTRFRYDVTLQLDQLPRHDPAPRVVWWTRDALTFGALERMLTGNGLAHLVVRGVPNARVAAQVLLADRVLRELDVTTVSAVRGAGGPSAASPDVEEFERLAARAGYQIHVELDEDDASCVALRFMREPSGADAPAADSDAEPAPLPPFTSGGAVAQLTDAPYDVRDTNDPLRAMRMRELPAALLASLAERLPAAALPEAVIIVPALPRRTS